MKFQSKITSQATLMEFPGHPEKILTVDIKVDCPVCGIYVLQIMGHHLRGLQRCLTELIERHPDLTGDEAGIEVLDRINFSGTSSPDPSRN